MNERYFVLDANVIYNYIGREKLGLSSDLGYNRGRMIRLLDQSILFISSSVLTEILVHFRNDLDKLSEVISFITSKIQYVLIASTDCADDNVLAQLGSARNEIEIKAILDSVLLNKVKIEVYVVYVFAGVISAIIGDLLIENMIKESKQNLNPDEYSEKAMKDIISAREATISKAENDLLNYYSQNKQDAGMKKIYDSFLEKNFGFYEKQLYDLLCTVSKDSAPDEDTFRLSLELSKTPEKMYMTIARLASDFKKVKNYKKQIEDKIVSVTIGWNRFDRYQKIYIAAKLEEYLGNTKFKKNDVFDTLFLGVYKEESIDQINKQCLQRGMTKCSRANYHLMSFDGDVSNFIYANDWKGALITDRLRNKRLFPDKDPKK